MVSDQVDLGRIVSEASVQVKVGDKVRLLDGESVGSIDAIEKKKAIVNYGIFRTQVNVDQLELVK